MRNPLFSEASLGFALSRKAYHFAGLCRNLTGTVRNFGRMTLRNRLEGSNRALNKN
jgi:hypothetical protein